jgi:LPXTG-site transpeptidase (sortase) family protein
MIRRLKQYERQREDARSQMTTRRKIVWTTGNILILIGFYLLLFVGGLMADEQYNVYAASGDNDEIAPIVVAAPPAQQAADPAAPAQVAPAPVAARPATRFNIPILNNGSAGALTNAAVPSAGAFSGPSTISRIVAPAIGLDKKVIEVGWTIEQQADGQQVAIWDVDKYRVGHHQGTSNPGGGGNIVLAGHSGGRAYPFNDIFYLKPGDSIELYSNNQLYQYTVTDHILVDEVGQPLEKRLENARYIESTGEEVVTMVACWPLTGPDKFKQRIIIRAKPVGVQLSADQTNQEHSGWTAR